MRKLTTEQLRRVESLFERAVEQDAEGRDRFIDATCADDAVLRSAVRSLLRSHERAGDFLETPVMRGVYDDAQATPSAGNSLAHYQIIREIGRGGMGEVYLARDPKLDRLIALKLLPRQFTKDAGQVKRFEREARAASALNHPNIITIHDIGRDDDTHFIATEFIEGRTLRERLAIGKLPALEAVEIAMQIAQALSAAHTAGIVHRDIKPENIMVRDDGLIKVLDFGLAKPLGREVLPHSARRRITNPLTTNPGTFMGTLCYMSPEQVLRKTADHRTDIFSLGVVMYEMLAGERPFKGPFKGEDTAALLDAILYDNPAPLDKKLSDANSGGMRFDLAVEFRRILDRALAKEREDRYQATADLLLDLKQLARDLSADSKDLHSIGGQGSKRLRGWARAAATVGGVLLLTTSAYLATRPDPPPASAKAAIITAAEPVTQAQALEYYPSFSPDGEALVYESYAAGRSEIYLQRVGERTAVNLTEEFPYNAGQPAFSPDGARIAFWSGGIHTMNADGSDIRKVTSEGYNPAWSPDGTEILYATDRIIGSARSVIPSQLWAVNITTLEKRLITERDAAQPNWSPTGRRIAFWGLQKGGQRDIWTVPADSDEPVAVTSDEFEDWNPVWSPDGKYLYFVSNRGGSMNLWRVAIEEQTGKVLSQPEPVTTPAASCWHISFSRDGRRVAYVKVDRRANIKRVGFDPVKAQLVGEEVAITRSSGFSTEPHLASDDQVLVYSSVGENQEDLFLLELSQPEASGAKSAGSGDNRTPLRLTDDIYKDRSPQWSPDRRQIAFYSDRDGKFQIWMVNRDGSGRRQLTNEEGEYVFNPVWSPDSRRLAYAVNVGGSVSTYVIEAAKARTEQAPYMLTRSDPLVSKFLPASWSRDGSRLAGWQNWTEMGKAGIFIYSFATGRYERLTDFGSHPIWMRDNRRLLFCQGDKLYALDARTRKIALIHQLTSNDRNDFCGITLSSDERHLYFSQASTEADVWVAEMK